MNVQLALLILCQGFFLVNGVTVAIINGLVGVALAPHPWMATLPLVGQVAGSALFTGVVARHQRAWGRRKAFQAGLGAAAISSSLCAYAAMTQRFWLFVVGTVLTGYYIANAGLYRFAAAEIVKPEFKERAISWVLAGGILGAVAGPNLAIATRNALPVPYAGAYASLILVAFAAMIALSFISFPPIPAPDPALPGRSVRELARQPVFVVAVMSTAFGSGVMNLLMAATPIAMAHHAHSFTSIAFVLEWHVLGMFVPSFFTGSLIKKFGAASIMSCGALLHATCIAIALSGTDVMRFGVALFILGVGWNFLFVGGTTLLTEAYRPEEKTTAQAAMDFSIYGTMTLTSFGAGALVTTQGWSLLTLGAIVPVIVSGTALGWLLMRRRGALAPSVLTELR